jgi:uncharacterized repeat protein (TIGR02543 family)
MKYKKIVLIVLVSIFVVGLVGIKFSCNTSFASYNKKGLNTTESRLADYQQTCDVLGDGSFKECSHYSINGQTQYIEVYNPSDHSLFFSIWEDLKGYEDAAWNINKKTWECKGTYALMSDYQYYLEPHSTTYAKVPIESSHKTSFGKMDVRGVYIMTDTGHGDGHIFVNWWNFEHTVTFESNGGTFIPFKTVETYAKLPEPAMPLKTDYVFLGWYNNSSFLGKPFNFNTPIKSNITLYAKWKYISEYVVLFNLNDESKIIIQNVKAGEKVVKPTDPIKVGYKTIWYVDPKLTGDIFNFDTIIHKNLTLYAKYVKIDT